MTMAKQILQRAEGWKFAGANGKWTVWHAGKNDYRVTEGHDGAVFGQREQFSDAHKLAEWCNKFDGGRAI